MPRPLRELEKVVRERRLELGLTQSDLEDETALDRSYISKLELAKRVPDLLAIFHIAKKLQLEPHELILRVQLAMKQHV
jgi:transcriptional regulator with XRE-family HTH domain